MAQNIYDKAEFFEGYSQLPRQRLGLDGAPEWPALRAMLPDLTGSAVADLGCGFGWVSRWMRQHGASSVLGVDLSQNMIDRARKDTRMGGIDYQIADLDSLQLRASTFDCIFSSLTFHYVEDFRRLSSMIHSALKPGGRLVFTIEHPIFMAAAHPHWLSDEDGRKTWPVNQYSIEGQRRTDWFAKGVLKYHRTMTTTLNTLIDTGFTVRRVEEFVPSPDQLAETPSLAEELERPMILMIAAQRQ